MHSAGHGAGQAALDVVRTGEFATIDEIVATPGAVGRVVVVVGDPGSGKTHLLGALVRDRQWSDRPATVHRCVSRQGISDGTATPAAALRRIGETGRSSAAATVPVGQRTAHHPPRPLVVLDDAHLGGDDVRAEVTRLVTSQLPPAADVVLALRPRQCGRQLDEVLALGAEFGRVTRIDLDPLDDHALRDVVPVAVPAELRRRSAGNPFALRALYALEEAARTGNDSALAPFELVVLRETRSLDPDTRRVLHAAAVLRHRSGRDLLADVAEVQRDAAGAAVQDLVRRDLLRVDRCDRVRLRDELLGTLLHRTLDPCWAAAAHERALELLARHGAEADDQRRGYHLAHSPARIRERQLPRIVDAADELAATDPTTAMSWLTSVIADAPAASAVGDDARLALGSALGRVGRLAESRELLVRVAESGRVRRGVLAPRIAACAVVEGVLSHDVQALELLAAELDATARSGSGEDVTWTQLVLARHLRLCLTGQPADLPAVDAAIAVAEFHDDHLVSAGLRGVLAVEAVGRGDTTTAVADLRRADSLLERLPDHHLADGLAAVLTVSLGNVYLGRWTQAARHLGRGVAVAEARNRTYMLPTLLVLLSEAERQLGRLRWAAEAAEAAMTESPPGNEHRHPQALALMSLAQIWHQPTGSGRAKLLAQQALARQPRAQNSVNGCAAVAALTLARTAWLDGDADHCITLLLNEGRGSDLDGMPAGQRMVVWELLAAAALESGSDAARRLPGWVERAAELAARHPLPLHAAYAQLTRAHADRAEGAIARAVSGYDQAARAFSRVDMPVEQAYALGHAVRALAAAGRARAATDRIALATEIARRCDAPTLLDWVSNHPSATGADPVVGTTFGDLTSREHEIALMVGTGLKRREIAEQLDISLRTVDVHLTRVYRKTGVRSQVQLALAMQEVADRQGGLQRSLGSAS